MRTARRYDAAVLFASLGRRSGFWSFGLVLEHSALPSIHTHAREIATRSKRASRNA
ncbi:hypothetical protein V474_02190 [Novosphingobium barchaimii LL02]|uniref:Uncharacterized protein n=1 Tax=Novosphingobium barchaimii LL02 TaxID=1114963 RepID=A0A0J7XL93_9SPHN|nr:hypothetical protein V474_02190 [Novosphingobium barchaimii LL02]